MGMEDVFIEQNFGKTNPFKVPDGYFEGLQSQIMQRIPENASRVATLRPTIWRKTRYMVAVAACACGLIAATATYISTLSSERESNARTAIAVNSAYKMNALDYVAEYSMMDNEDIYAIVSEN